MTNVPQTDARVERVAHDRLRRADVCCVAIAECFRGDGEIVANPIGTIPRIGGLLARLSFEPDLVMTDGEAMFTSADDQLEAWNPYRSMFDVVCGQIEKNFIAASPITRTASITGTGQSARTFATRLCALENSTAVQVTAASRPP